MKNLKANNKKATVNTNKKATVNNMQDIFDYVNNIAKTNANVKLQTVTGYVALKYANKTIAELHDKKRSIAHITFSNKSKAFELAKNNKAVTRVVPDSYGWRLNTECLLNENMLQIVTAVIDSLIAETIEQFDAKNKKAEAKKQQKTA